MEQQDTFVLAAQVAANLHFASRVARQLSLTAKNAHAISARAGQQSAGFRAITTYIEELSENTIAQADVINHEAMAISMLASDRARAMRALQHFTRAAELAPDATYIRSIETPRGQTQSWLVAIDRQFSDRLIKLYSQLQEIQQQMRAAVIIATSSKIEATLAGSFEAQLEVIAQNVTDATDEIGGYLRSAQRLISSAIDNLEDRAQSL